MKNSELIYVTGHQHPDTDSIASAIAYSFFKKANGIPAIPCRLGPLNAETKYLLERFGFEEPMLLKDARVMLSEIKLDPLTYITPETTIFESLHLMQQENHTYCGVVDEEMHLVGLVTKSDIAVVGLGDTSQSIEIMKNTPTENFRKTIDGTMIHEASEPHLNGKVSIVAMTEPERFEMYDVKDRIVLIGNKKDIQMRAIEKGAGMLILMWVDGVDSEVVDLAEEHQCSIIISGHGVMNTSRYLYFAPSVKTIMKTQLVTFQDQELAEDVGTKMLRSRFHIYPVVDAENRLTGYVARYHIMNAVNKSLILVDHNEFSQSVRSIDKARVLEVIDHHRINDFATTQPVQFRNEIVGSTATVVATIFRENQIPMPANMAGLLLGAVLSDTMNFHSPTTTERDKVTANILAALADIDIDKFAEEIFAVSANTTGKSLSEMMNQDRKIFDIKGCKVSISQVMISSVAAFQYDSIETQKALEKFAEKKNLDLCVLVLSSIMENGSIFYVGGPRSEWGKKAFPDKEGEVHSLFEGVLSRKSQVLPMLTEVISKYM